LLGSEIGDGLTNQAKCERRGKKREPSKQTNVEPAKGSRGLLGIGEGGDQRF